MNRLAESAGDIRDGRGDASHRQLLKDIENANVLTGGCVFRSHMTAKGNADSFHLRS